jgi:Protein of unknown function (DUF1579)
MGVGGLWLRETFKADFAGKKFEGRGLMSYDSANKKYVGVWVDSMATVPMPDGKSLEAFKIAYKRRAK